MPGPEHSLVEQPILEYLVELGYAYLPPADTRHGLYTVPENRWHRELGDNEAARDGLHQVLLRDDLLAAVRELNDVTEDDARRVYNDLLGVSDNETWTQRLRGDYSLKVSGQAHHKTLHLIDFENPDHNRFTVTHQLPVKAHRTRIPDIVVYVNGIPLVVIEAKTPFSYKAKTGFAFEQIGLYQTDIPRLFHSNLFNIVTDAHDTLYGATGAPSQFWGTWRDPWPRTPEDFDDPLRQSLWSLLEPARLLDILAHFVVFETRDGKTVKKVCRYQQYRAVGKIAQRVNRGERRQGLVWHTQGSGKSLTMVFAALKLKFHRRAGDGWTGPPNPNLLVLTDRKQLDEQIDRTFKACGLPDPVRVKSGSELVGKVRSDTHGLLVLSTIHKFEGSDRPVPGSDNWIVLVDEAHRSQEKDLGAYLRATLPDAWRFGFTGTPVKKGHTDTYANFGAPGELYLDKYGIDNAVADGQTVPIYYKSRMTRWSLEPTKIDTLFAQWFDDQPDDWVEQIKKSGVTTADLLKHPGRMEAIAFDIWEHYKSHVRPDGFKAQIVAVDRAAVVLYKRVLDRVIAEDLLRTEDGLTEEDARRRAEAKSACVISEHQRDQMDSEDEWTRELRADLRRWNLTDRREKEVVADFRNPDHPLVFLIVCNKLLTGFDAPIEQVLYLDSPLREHGLLQAIARTNRVAGPAKKNGLVVDYVGVSRRLDEALESYRAEDVAQALRDPREQEDELAAARADLETEWLKGIPRGIGNMELEYAALTERIKRKDGWDDFQSAARRFMTAYDVLSPDPAVLPYRDDLRWVGGYLRLAALHFDRAATPFLKDYGAQVRRILEEHVEVTGLETVVKLRDLSDPAFRDDFDFEAMSDLELERAAARKAAELKAELTAAEADNPLRFGPFSERVREIIRRLDQAHIDSRQALEDFRELFEDYDAERKRFRDSGLDERAYGVYVILDRSAPDRSALDRSAEGGHRDLARRIDDLYRGAPAGWIHKTGLRKDLRKQVRRWAHAAGGFDDLIELTRRVDAFARNHYADGGA